MYSIHVWDIWWPYEIRCTLIACFAEKEFTAIFFFSIIVYENALNQEKHKSYSPYTTNCRFPYASFFVSVTDLLECILPYFTSNMFGHVGVNYYVRRSIIFATYIPTSVQPSSRVILWRMSMRLSGVLLFNVGYWMWPVEFDRWGFSL